MATLDDGLEFPSELCWGPQALVGVAGLDTLNNAVHRIVWEALANSRRQDRSPVYFKLLGPVHEFPPMKPKRNSYEWYIPKGILKRNWMKKHLKEIPAVVVIFYDLDWDDSEWPEKKIECTSRVQSIRAALEGRNTRLGIVLIQQKAPVLAGEDVLAVERAAALCTAADISPKCLFVLPHVDHLQGYVLRLENAFHEMAQGYYQQEIRHIKSHREFLNKTTHQYLFVRHQLKMAFLSELRQDNRNAHVHYSASYSNLLELRINDTNSLELKSVAGYIVYKVCRLLFLLNQPRDAISQFRSHIEHFRGKVGPPELVFQHHAWLAKQYCLFGELFEEAIRGGLPAVQTMHPGYYYEQAARHAVDRKAASSILCQGVEKYPANDPLSGVNTMEFYGQRPWRAGSLSAQPPDPTREIEGIIALQYRERHNVNHSAVIISLLGNAITQYKTYRCPRMRRHLAIQMADEYYSSRDYGKALTLLTHMLWDYRSEAWHLLLTSLLSKALCCAYLTASVREYLDVALEALAYFNPDAQHRVFHNLQAIIKGGIPEPEPGVSREDAVSARALWVAKSPAVYTVDMNNISSCIDCKARLVQENHNSVDIQVLIRSRFLKTMQFLRLSVCVNSLTLSSEFAMCDTASDKLHFAPDEVKSFLCQITLDPQDAGKEIQIGSILLELGSEKGQRLVLRFSGNEITKNVLPELKYFRFSPPKDAEFDKFSPAVTLTLAHPTALLDLKVSHDAPALQNSWHRLTVCLHNPEDGPITQVTLHVAIKPTLEDPTIEQKTDMCETVASGLLSLPLSLSMEDIEAQATAAKSFYMRPHTLVTRHLSVFVTYLSSKGEHCAQTVEESVAVKQALEVKYSFMTTRCEPVTKLFSSEPFFIVMQLDCLSPSPINIQHTDLQLLECEVFLEQTKYECQLAGTTLGEGEVGTCIACIKVNDPTEEQPLTLGNFVIHWNREGGEVSTLTVPLPTVTVEFSPLQLGTSLPAHGLVRTPLPVAYLVYNRTSTLLTISLNMEPSEAFMFAGHKQVQMRVLPQSCKKFEYNLYPLLSGLVALPQLKLTVHSELATPQLVAELIDRAIPSHVYIMPQARSRSTTVQ